MRYAVQIRVMAKKNNIPVPKKSMKRKEKIPVPNKIRKKKENDVSTAVHQGVQTLAVRWERQRRKAKMLQRKFAIGWAVRDTYDDCITQVLLTMKKLIFKMASHDIRAFHRNVSEKDEVW